MYPPTTWRLIVDDARDGAWNMAVDEAIVTAVGRGDSLPTLRFYQWEPPCLSLGRSQSDADVDTLACHRAGIHCVRRPTGGRAILHQNELTYSLSLPLSDPRAAGDIVESYRRLSEGLADGLRRLGLAIQRAQPGKAQTDAAPACFETLAGYEITVGGRKLLGSAQFRTRTALLQHGSLPLYGDVSAIVDFLSLADVAREAMRQRLRATATTVEQALGWRVPLADAAAALCRGITDALNVRLVEGHLSPEETDIANRLQAEKYADMRHPAHRRSETAPSAAGWAP